MPVVIRTGWTSTTTPNGRVYTHVTGWQVTDYSGPGNAVAKLIAGPNAGQQLLSPQGGAFWSADQAMQAVEAYLRGNYP